MKKTTIFLCTFFAAHLLFAQTESKPHKNKLQYLHALEARAGYNIIDSHSMFIDHNHTLAPFNHCWSVGLHEIHGMQFNPHISLSAVIGVNFHKMYPDKKAYLSDQEVFHDSDLSYSWPYPNLYVLDFELGLNFKYIILKKRKWSPYLTLEVCPISAELIRLQGSTYRDWYRRGSASFIAGAQYSFKDRQSVYAALGYELAFSQLFLSVGVRLR
ncbi:MAG: hypothetical protein J5730_04800 [Bacteroidales bacterium]|nr:hypothetical protein [Bacteroidales bacterium]